MYLLAATVLSLMIMSCDRVGPTTPDVVHAELTLHEPSIVTAYYANPKVEIVDHGNQSIGVLGVCWNTTGSPDLSDNYLELWVDQWAIIKNLQGATTYFLRAFAHNGDSTIFSNEIKIETPILSQIKIGDRIIEVSPVDQRDSIIWGKKQRIMGADNFDDGERNTLLLEANDSSIAARVCSELDTLGYDDWYLPAINELEQIFVNKEYLRGFDTTYPNIYWSSTEKGPYAYTGHMYFWERRTAVKNLEYFKCRCVRLKK